MRKPKLPPPPPDRYKVGYARVSTSEQNLDMQIDALKRYGVEEKDIYVEKVSTRKAKRPVLDLALSELRPDDLFVVWRMDRIARSVRDLLNRVDSIKEAGADLVSLTEAIDLSTPAGKVMMTMIAAMAEFERDLISERTSAGMRAFKERGGKVGRARSLDAKGVAKALKLLNSGYGRAAVARECGVSPTTIFNYFEFQPRKKVWRERQT
jgi:DNA invertase Pin-like site-specific DNA recombinase